MTLSDWLVTSTQNTEILQHIYGACSGIYTAVCAYLILAGLSHNSPNTRSIAKTFYLYCFAFFLFSFYGLFFQHYTQAVSVQAIPEGWLNFSKYATPIALALITRVFLKYSVIMSYRAYELSLKYNWVANTLYLFDAACVIALFFITDLNVAAALITFAFVPHALIVTRYTRVVIKSLSLGRFFSFMLLSCALHSLVLALLIINGINFSPLCVATYCLVFALTTLCFSFIAVRYGYDEAKLYFHLKEIDHHHLIHGIHKALENDDFYLVYQPQIDLKSGQLFGLEALIRWSHPKLGPTLPENFIPLAEKADLIDGVCRWVIRRAVKDCRKFMDLGYQLRTSINFSAKNVNPEIVEYLAAVLQEHQVPAHSLGIEITESLMVHESDESKQALQMMHEMGIPLSLDDYGTGFSSLSYVNKLALHEIKIDRSFVTDIDSNKDNHVISQSTIRMSKTLGLKVVAEGVESEDVLNELKSMDCDIAQGYFIAHPMPLAELEDWLKQSKYQ